ncbi:MAG: hypothetical protein WD603_03610 [Patescibacteria group bacterium]
MQNILVDIDDTLADTQTAMLRYINQKSNQTYRLEELTREHRENTKLEYDKLAKEFMARPDLIARCAPYADALDAFRKLHGSGFVIHIVSSRREPLHDITLDWLREHGFADYVTEVHPRSSKQSGREFKCLISEKIRPVAAFDDTMEIAEALADMNITVYLIHQPWNAGESLPPNVHRSKTFAAAVNAFLSQDRASSAPAPPN